MQRLAARLIALSGCVLSLAAPGFGQAIDQPRIFFPAPLDEQAVVASIGFTLTTPPRDLTEEASLRAPAIDAHLLYGLPEHFLAHARVTSQVVQNRISLGAKWAVPMGRVSLSVGYDVAFWFGFLEVGGFDSKARGWENTPNITVGYALDRILLSLKTEAILTTSYSSFNGDQEVSSDVGTFSGMAFSFVLEQPAWKHTHLSLGFRAAYTKVHWMTWALFSTFDRYLFYPELTVGFLL